MSSTQFADAAEMSFAGVPTVIAEEIYNGEKGYAIGPVRSLMSALLFDGVQSYMMYESGGGNSGKKKNREAFNWVHSRAKEYIFSFDNVCEALGIDPEYLRCGLSNVTRSHESEWKRGRRNF